MSSLPDTRSAATLAQAIGVSLHELKMKLKTVLRQVHQLEHHADFVSAIAQGRPARIKQEKPLPPANGEKRSRGRPKGAKNSSITLYATKDAIARLRSELQP